MRYIFENIEKRQEKVKKILLICCIAFIFGACGNNNGGDAGLAATAEASETGLPWDITGELTIMGWSGDGVYYRDAGRSGIDPASVSGTGTVAAAFIATAEAFNQLFPNVIINVYAQEAGPYANDISWSQHRENFAMEHGYADIFYIVDLAEEMSRGLVGDISIFSNTQSYRAFNPELMQHMNFNGRQLGLPETIIPWGVFVNKSLADANNIDIPDPDWTFEEYLSFINHSSPNEFYGAMGVYWDIINTGTNSIERQIQNRGPDDPFVTLNTQEVRDMLALTNRQLGHTIWPQYDRGNIAGEFMDENWWWGWRFFTQGSLLTLDGDPWMMLSGGTEGSSNFVVASNWDVYPRPSTQHAPLHVSAFPDPMSVRNFAMDDGNPELNDEELLKLKLAYEFLAFHITDPRAWQARADYRFGEYGEPALNFTFPSTTGELFDEQMAIWFEVHPDRFGDPNQMPGFHKVIELWQEGQLVFNIDRTFPIHHEFEGSRRQIMHEWNRKWAEDAVGADYSNPNWLDMVYARLPEWDALFDARWREVFVDIDNSLARFYPVLTPIS